MSNEELFKVQTIIASLISEEENYKEQAKKDRLFELVSHHVGGVRSLRKLSVIIDEMVSSSYGEISK